MGGEGEGWVVAAAVEEEAVGGEGAAAAAGQGETLRWGGGGRVGWEVEEGWVAWASSGAAGVAAAAALERPVVGEGQLGAGVGRT